MVEPFTILSGALLAILMRPRFWVWDRLAACGRRSRAVAAVAGIVLPALCVPAVVPWLPPATPWAWVLANALLLSTTVHPLAPQLSPLAAGGLAVLSWLSSGLTTNLAPHVRLPISSYRDPDGNWTVVAVLIVVAIVLHVRTCGSVARAHHQYGQEQRPDLLQKSDAGSGEECGSSPLPAFRRPGRAYLTCRPC